jgi:hypothetical protein
MMLIIIESPLLQRYLPKLGKKGVVTRDANNTAAGRIDSLLHVNILKCVRRNPARRNKAQKMHAKNHKGSPNVHAKKK